MTTQAILIINATIVNEGNSSEEDILIKDGRIAAIGKRFQLLKAQRLLMREESFFFPVLSMIRFILESQD